MNKDGFEVLGFSHTDIDVSRRQLHNYLLKCGRPEKEARELQNKKKNLDFFLIDIQTVSAVPTKAIVDLYSDGLEGKWIQKANEHSTEIPVIQLFGTTMDQTSVLAHVWGYFGYLYFQLPLELEDKLDQVHQVLEEALKSSGVSKQRKPQNILSLTKVYAKNLLHYSGDSDTLFCRVLVASSQQVSTLRTCLERGIRVDLGFHKVSLPTLVFDANIPFELKFLADFRMSGGCWIKIMPSDCIIRTPELQTSSCQIEIDVPYHKIKCFAAENEYQKLPPLRVLSFDIECVTEHGTGFPSPKNDKVIQIATTMKTHDGTPIYNIILTLNTCCSIPGALVCWFDTEKEMLLQWRQIVFLTDPDIITGYNCINFDLNYLLIRAMILKADMFPYLSRITSISSKIRDVINTSRQSGTFENKLINTEGRIQMDMLHIIRRDFKLKSYTLNAVSAHFIKEQKEDVHYSMIGQLFHGTSETRRRIASYCLKDALLPLQLMERLCIIVNYVEMARVTGTPISFLLTRGQQIKVTSQILRKCRELNYLFPCIRGQAKVGDSKYEGATVLEPLKGLYKLPIATLDFASLYPSIMVAHNLCYSTLCVEPLDALHLAEDDVIRTPSNSIYVKHTKRRGVLPLIVEDLVEARKIAKKQMEKENDPMMKSVLNGRQIALKLSANSVYGYTGATAGGQLPCLEVSTSITAYGREMIEKTKRVVENHYRTENGYPFDATVVYGDTDSVMVLFGVTSIAEAMLLGKEAADLVTQQFNKPIKLEFEKIFCPFLLMNKKRYAGVLYTSPEKYSRLDFKGIETVRRDFCLLVQQLVDTVLKKILLDQDEEGAKEYVKYIVSQLLQNNIDLSLLVVSKSLGKEEYTSKLAHVELAKKMRQRDPGKAPQIGDRIHFVIIPGVKGQPQYDRAEDPLYALENNLTIDTQYYLDNIKNPLIRIFEGVMDNPESLFSGAHTQKKKVLTSTSSALSRFVKASLRCIGCRSIIKDGALCDFCTTNHLNELVMQKILEVRAKEKEFSRLWAECQRCQGSITQDVLCTSRDCPIFYRRMKVKKDIAEVQSQMERLEQDW